MHVGCGYLGGRAVKFSENQESIPRSLVWKIVAGPSRLGFWLARRWNFPSLVWSAVGEEAVSLWPIWKLSLRTGTRLTASAISCMGGDLKCTNLKSSYTRIFALLPLKHLETGLNESLAPLGGLKSHCPLLPKTQKEKHMKLSWLIMLTCFLDFQLLSNTRRKRNSKNTMNSSPLPII